MGAGGRTAANAPAVPGDWPRKQKALFFVHADLVEEVVFARSPPFGDHLNANASAAATIARTNDCDTGLKFTPRTKLLSSLMASTRQLRQRRIAGAEVVEMHLRAHFAQPGDQRVRDSRLQSGCFRSTRSPTDGGHAVARHPEQVVDDAVVGQLPGGEVDRHPQIQSYCHCAARRRRSAHPLPQRADQAGLLGVGDELQRRIRPRSGESQRTSASTLCTSTARVDFRLVIQHQLILPVPLRRLASSHMYSATRLFISGEKTV